MLKHYFGSPRRALAVLLAVLWAAQAMAQEWPSLVLPGGAEPVKISADQVVWDRNDNLLELNGHVVVEHPEYRITADRARADVKTRVVRAAGNVTVWQKEAGEERLVLNSEEVEIDTRSGAGWMVHARMSVPWKESVFLFEGDRFQRVDDHTYLIENGAFTWCACEDGEKPDWSVSADRIEADTEGDAEFRGARVHIRGTPVLALPYFRYPLSQNRKSGFLFPEIETSSSDGFHFELPYYWVISRSADLTFMPRYIQDRGIDVGGEVRYNFGEPAHGESRGFFIEDRDEHVWRNGIRVTHRTDVGDIFTGAADVVYLSDNEVLFDYDHRDLGDEHQRAVESRVVLSYHWPYMNLTGEFSVFDDLMGGDVRPSPFGEDNDEFMVQRLPALYYTLLTRPLFGPVLFDVSAYAANYYRQEVEHGRGQLLTVAPRVAVPYRAFGAVDLWAAAGYREWFLVPDQEFDSRNSTVGRPEAEAEASVQFERVYHGQDTVTRHAIRPALVYYYAGDPENPGDDFFRYVVPNLEQNLGGIRLENKWWVRGASANRIHEAARVEITQLFDFEADEWRDLRFEGRMGQPTAWRLYLDTYYSWELWEWTRAVAEVGYVFEETAEARVGYLYDSGEIRAPYFDFATVENEAITGMVMVRPLERQTYIYRIYYSVEYDRVVRQSFEWDYVARQKCWGVNVMVSDRIRPSDPEGDHEISGSLNLRIVPP